MAPNGVEAGDLRVLVNLTSDRQSVGDLIRAVFVGHGWTVTVTPVDSHEVIAERRVGRRSAAERVRGEFVRRARANGVDRTDTARVERLLRG